MTEWTPAVAALLTDERLMPLGPGTPNVAARAALLALNWDSFSNRVAARACHAGLWLYHDFLHESHEISQDLPDAAGSCLHAIMHRREPDAGNSKYWWRRVGPHPVLRQLEELAPALGYEYTSPFAFVDFCEHVRDTGTADEELARRVQLLEWRLLFADCYRHAAQALS